MPIISGTEINIDGRTETPEIAANSIKIILGGFATLFAVTQTPPATTGRDRSPEFATAFTDGSVSVFHPLRIRRAPVLIEATTQTREARYVVSPTIPVPEVQLFYDLKSIGDASVTRGANFDLSFLVTGYKLSTLWVEFQILDLSDDLLVKKKYQLSPGGAVVDETTILPNGMEQIKGTIFILSGETEFLPEECKYAFLIGNRFTRKAKPLCGNLTFNC